MKSRPLLLIPIAWILLSLTLVAQTSFHWAPASVDANEKLTGSDLSIKDAVNTASAIFRGELIEIGAPVLKGIGLNYYGVKINVQETYLGTVDADASDVHNVLVSLLVLPRPENERCPIVCHLYIVFVQKTGSSHLTVLKLLSATDENVAEVNKLIVAGPDQHIPPVAQLNEIDVDYVHPGSLYFIRIGTDGSAALACASMFAGCCPPKTFNFEQLYNELSAQPEVPPSKSPYSWAASFRWRNGQARKPMGRQIEDPKIILRILEEFVNSPMVNKQSLLKRFSDSTVLPPAEKAALMGL